MDAFQGHYKDGQDRTRDCKAASSIHLILVCLSVYGNENLSLTLKVMH